MESVNSFAGYRGYCGPAAYNADTIPLERVEPAFLLLRPDYKEFSRLAREFTLVPVVKSIAADLLTPVSAFLAVAANEPDAFLLESVERGEQIGGLDTFEVRDAVSELVRTGVAELSFGSSVRLLSR